MGNVAENATGIAPLAESEFGVSRTYINRILRGLVTEGRLTATGATKARQYALAHHGTGEVFPLDGSVDEHVVWSNFVAPYLARAPIGVPAFDILNYGVTEMVNNAIDHSTGSKCEVIVSFTDQETMVSVHDDGVGIFKKIMAETGAEDEHHALLDLAKGRLTTDPERHSGEGIFFTSRACDLFWINSHELRFVGGADAFEWAQDHAEFAEGTQVVMTVQNDTDRSLGGLFDKFTSEGTYSFDITHVPVALARVGEENLVSRSQAKRLLTRISVFDHVALDFAGVESIGQAFADELFRVFPLANPEPQIIGMNMSASVESMVRRAQAARQSAVDSS